MLHAPLVSPFKAPAVCPLSAFAWIAEQRLLPYTALTDWFS